MKPNTAYFFMSCDAETDCFLFPVLPEKVTWTDSIKNTSITVASLGETTVIEKKGADTLSFNSRFPAVRDQAVVVATLYEPSYYKDKLEKWREAEKPVHFIAFSALDINDYFTIESLSYSEEGGPVGELAFSIKLKVYREPKIRKIDLTPEGKAEVTTEGKRVDNSITSTTYTVVKGDSLYKISKAKLGDGNKWKEIYELNKDKIKNPNVIKVGMVLKLPEQNKK
ncbi:MAG: LysM peptidoglycan-binding domain-containing protein [Clostridia bacterium]|nr:LysM peptidoglycan-binding domain-containing protein [Clostridia bacterium]